MKLTIDVNDSKLLALSQLPPYLDLDHGQLVEKAIDDILEKYWTETSIPTEKIVLNQTIDKLLEFGKNRTFGPDMTIQEAKEKGRA